MVNFLATVGFTDGLGVAEGVGVAEAVGVGVTTASCDSLILMVGEEKVKFLALNDSQPSFSFTTSVAIFCVVPSPDVTDTDALIGADVKLYKQRAVSDRIARS